MNEQEASKHTENVYNWQNTPTLTWINDRRF